MQPQTHDFLKLLQTYPSPHNGQPIRLHPISATEFDVYFERQRGLQSTDISFLFSFVSMGVFIQHACYCAEALGHALSYTLQLPSQDSLHGEGHVRWGTLRLAWNVQPSQPELGQALRFRQTSRRNYTSGLTEDTKKIIYTVAQDAQMKLVQLPPSKASEAIWLNQRAVFDDLFNEPVRRELDHWLRYTKKEKETARDGLAYDCMQLNGPLMRYIVRHPRIIRNRMIAPILKKYYTRTMADNSDVFYMMAPFETERQAFESGIVIMKIWDKIAASGAYLHPFGTIMSNDEAHRDFLTLANELHESRKSSYLVFIFRAGQSTRPVPSLRLPYETHLLMEAV